MAALRVMTAVVLGSLDHPEALQAAPRPESFTQNALCRQNNCINPVFPALNDLPRLDQVVWQCSDHGSVSSFVDFCGEVVNYDPALPSPNSSSELLNLAVKQQDDAAATMFFYHLSGLGYEAREHRHPSKSADECVKQVWKMACYTYFPKVQAGCQKGQATPYMRPCRNCCESYINACQVECCDESVQCVFEHQVMEAGVTTQMVQTGYTDAAGPSAQCTGSHSGPRSGLSFAVLLAVLAANFGVPTGVASAAAVAEGTERKRSRQASGAGAAAVSKALASSAWRLLPGRGSWLAVVALLLSMCLQGWQMDVPHHETGNWRAKPDYLVAYEFIPPGEPTSSAILNSCSKDVASTLQCSGRGYCKEWNPSSTVASTLSFCECDRDWADPECRTRRKSQVKTFLLSLFGGLFGADYFYLGYPWWGAAKLGTLGGLGFWWVLDIVRTGAGPVYAADYRVANDLPHWIYVLATVTLFGSVGFLLSIESYLTHRRKKREDLMKLHGSEEAQQVGKMDDILEGPRFRAGAQSRNFDDRREFSGYGATLPAPLPNGAAYGAPAGHHSVDFGPGQQLGGY